MCNPPHQEISEIVEIAVLLILDVDDAPFILSSSDGFAVYDDVAFASYYSEGNEGLQIPTGQNISQTIQ